MQCDLYKEALLAYPVTVNCCSCSPFELKLKHPKSCLYILSKEPANQHHKYRVYYGKLA
jgi:hypothetical protein